MEMRIRKCTRLLAAAVATIAMVALPSPALAATAEPTPPPSLTDDFSAADQYVESVPTSRGPKVPGVGKRSNRGGKPRKATLAPAVVTELHSRSGSGARTLERIATEPSLGAPVERLRTSSSKSAVAIPAATVKAVGEGEQDSIVLLVIALALITALAAGTAGHRYYERRKAAGRG
jgi:hypothetical protein